MGRADLGVAGRARVPVGAYQRLARVVVEAIDRRGRSECLRADGRPLDGRGQPCALSAVLAERRDDLMADLLERDAERLEDARGDALAFAHETEEQVLRPDVAVTELAGFVDRELDDLLGAWRERDLAR